jgi:hypothetical protein
MIKETHTPTPKFPKRIKNAIYIAVGAICFNTAINTAAIFTQQPIHEENTIELHAEEEHHRDEIPKVYIMRGDTLILANESNPQNENASVYVINGDSFVLQKTIKPENGIWIKTIK